MSDTIPSSASERPSNDRTDETALLLEFVHDRDVHCPRCGYNVRNLTQPVCPECREALVLTVGLHEHRHRWFLLAIAPGIFSGIAAVLLAIPIIIAAVRQVGPAPWEIVTVDIFGWASGFMSVALMRHRRRFLRMPDGQQAAFAALSWAIHLIVFAFLIVAMFG